MSFYNLTKDERAKLITQISSNIVDDLDTGRTACITRYFDNEDTYIRKAAYLQFGRIYFAHKNIQPAVINALNELLLNDGFKIRQTVVNAAGEIARKDFPVVQHFFDKGLFDTHPSVRNAVIGSIKKAGEVNPGPLLNWAKKYLQHEDKEVRREICHGIELRGRKYPQDILPLLKQLEHDSTSRVRNTIIHVLGQIAYKKGCLPTVVADLKTWTNKKLVQAALDEIADVHRRYQDFAAMTAEEAVQYIAENYE